MTSDASGESEAMLSYRAADYAKTVKTKDVCEDIENNNSGEKESAAHGENALARYSSNSKGVFAQCVVAGAVLILSAGAGMPIGYSAILLPQLSMSEGAMRIDAEMGSWIASVHSLSTPVGSLLSGPFLEWVGRRGCLQFSVIPLCVGWLLMGFAKSITSILVGRVVSGFSVGLMAVPAQVIVGEMADPGLRGFLVGGNFAAYCFGILLVYAFGASFNWDTVAFCGIALPVVGLVAISLVPESPAWLVRRDKIAEARKALLWLRGGDIDRVKTEIDVLVARKASEESSLTASASVARRFSAALAALFSPSVLKPIYIINVFNILQLTCGTYIIVFYAVDLIVLIGGGRMNGYLAAVVTGAIRALFCIMGCCLLFKMGRRMLGMLSAIGTALSSLVLAGYLFFKTENSYIDNYVLGACLLTYVGTNTAGLLTLPGLMIGELLPQRARGVAGGCCFFVFNLLLFVETKFFPLLNNTVGIVGVFTIFGISGILETIFIYVALPETKDRTLQDIEDYFQQKNFLWITRNSVKDKGRIIYSLQR